MNETFLGDFQTLCTLHSGQKANICFCAFMPNPNFFGPLCQAIRRISRVLVHQYGKKFLLFYDTLPNMRYEHCTIAAAVKAREWQVVISLQIKSAI